MVGHQAAESGGLGERMLALAALRIGAGHLSMSELDVALEPVIDE
jgi:hypothetical protein